MGRQEDAITKYCPTPEVTEDSISYSWHPTSRNNEATITTFLGNNGMARIRVMIIFPPSWYLLEQTYKFPEKCTKSAADPAHRMSTLFASVPRYCIEFLSPLIPFRTLSIAEAGKLGLDSGNCDRAAESRLQPLQLPLDGRVLAHGAHHCLSLLALDA